MLEKLTNRLRRWWFPRGLGVWYHPAYRLPLAGLDGQVGIEPRRADFVAWYLLDKKAVPASALHTPEPVSWADLARVHEESWLESLSRPETLARIFAASPYEIRVDELMQTVRLACGGTLAAARSALATGRAELNLLGGFHHAGRGHGGGFCAVNDLAIALAVLRSEGFTGRAVVLDLDAHPPDGTADCLRGDPKAWIGSISGSDWGAVEGADEVLLKPGTGDGEYLAALDALLARMPRPDLAFVVAGGDVLAGDKFGTLALTLEGVRERDRRVADRLAGVASVWVPGGGYSDRSWRVLAGSALVLALDSDRRISPHYDPLGARFAAIAAGLTHAELGHEPDLETEDLEVALGLVRRGRRLLLDYYTAQGVEFALFQYGLYAQLERLGYTNFRVELDQPGHGDRVRLFGEARGERHLLVESVLERKVIAGDEMLYIHWLTLRHPLAQFDERRPKLPGQDVPGLGLAREVSELHLRIVRRLGLKGVAFRPSWYHMAYTARSRFRFLDPKRQGRFLALMRDTSDRPLVAVTLAVANGKVRMNGEPYTWEADEMVYWLDEQPEWDERACAEEQARVRFTLVPEARATPPGRDQQ